MTDIVQNAMNYRQALLEDISKVDEFLRIGEYLLRLDRGASDVAGSNVAAKAATVARPAAPAEAGTPENAGSPVAEATPASLSAAEGSAKSAQGDSPEAPPRRALAFRGACEDSGSEPRRNIA